MIKAINVINTTSLKNKEIDDLIKFYNSYDDKKFEIVIVIPKGDEIKNKLNPEGSNPFWIVIELGSIICNFQQPILYLGYSLNFHLQLQLNIYYRLL